MKSLTSWLLAFFMIMFWAFRIIVTLVSQREGNFGGFIVFDNTIEIVILFVTVLCFILFLKRNILGSLIYVIAQGYYFGNYIIFSGIPALTAGEALDINILANASVGVLGIALALFTLLDIAFEKTTTKHYSDKKTDWFFNNKNYDRQFDERADRNQYKF